MNTMAETSGLDPVHLNVVEPTVTEERETALRSITGKDGRIHD